MNSDNHVMMALKSEEIQAKKPSICGKWVPSVDNYIEWIPFTENREQFVTLLWDLAEHLQEDVAHYNDSISMSELLCSYYMKIEHKKTWHENKWKLISEV